jgi:hypothetical protein
VHGSPIPYLSAVSRQIWVEDAETNEVVQVIKDNIGDLRGAEGKVIP